MILVMSHAPVRGSPMTEARVHFPVGLSSVFGDWSKIRRGRRFRTCLRAVYPPSSATDWLVAEDGGSGCVRDLFVFRVRRVVC